MLVAHIDTTHGLRGEVSAALRTDFPERFGAVERLCVGPEGAPEEGRRLELRGWRLHRGKVLLRFAGVESIDAARRLVGCDVWVAADEAVELPEGSYYQDDLLGLVVRDREGRRIGEVADVLRTGGADVLVVRSGEREVLVPAARSICVKVDVENGELVIEPPEGLLEINAD